MNEKVVVREIDEGDVDSLFEIFHPWRKKRELFETYLNMHRKGERSVIVAKIGAKAVGYCTITWESFYEQFRHRNIPEIVDLNVIDEYQGLGIAKNLIYYAEEVIKSKGHNTSGISCTPSDDFSSPCQIYVRTGYTPDGFGITDYDEEIHLIKSLKE